MEKAYCCVLDSSTIPFSMHSSDTSFTECIGVCMCMCKWQIRSLGSSNLPEVLIQTMTTSLINGGSSIGYQITVSIGPLNGIIAT